MKLYGMAFSPYTQRVLMAARLKGQELAVEPPPGGGVFAEAYQAIALNGRIPMLEEADGWRLCESPAIIAYLDEVLPGPKLGPEDARGRARARQIEAIADYDLGPSLRHFALQKMFTVYSEPAQLAYGRAEFAAGLRSLGKVGVGNDRWAVGETPGIADTVLVPVFSFAEIMQTHFDAGPLIGDGEVPGVDAYWARAKADPVGARVLETMSGIVPVIMARRAKAAQA